MQARTLTTKKLMAKSASTLQNPYYFCGHDYDDNTQCALRGSRYLDDQCHGLSILARTQASVETVNTNYRTMAGVFLNQECPADYR